jgi:hypothetical protein
MGRYDKDHSVDTHSRADVMKEIEFVVPFMENEEANSPANPYVRPTG